MAKQLFTVSIGKSPTGQCLILKAQPGEEVNSELLVLLAREQVVAYNFEEDGKVTSVDIDIVLKNSKP